jgi:hypothetical protein
MEPNDCPICYDDLIIFDADDSIIKTYFYMCHHCQVMFHINCAKNLINCPKCQQTNWCFVTNTDREFIQTQAKYYQNQIAIDKNLDNIDAVNKVIKFESNKYGNLSKKMSIFRYILSILIVLIIFTYFYKIGELNRQITETSELKIQLNHMSNILDISKLELDKEKIYFNNKYYLYARYNWLNFGNMLSENIM